MFPQIIHNNNKIISKMHEDTHTQAFANYNFEEQQCLNICAIFKPCLSGTTAVSDPGVRQLWPSAHGAAGY
jgi:hypothetical protein